MFNTWGNPNGEPHHMEVLHHHHHNHRGIHPPEWIHHAKDVFSATKRTNHNPMLWAQVSSVFGSTKLVTC